MNPLPTSTALTSGESCPTCPRRVANPRNLHGARITFAQPNGPSPAEVMVVGDAPDANANRKAWAMCGKFGRELDDCYLPAAGLDRSMVYVTYAQKCMRADAETPTPDQARACAEYWLPREMAAVNPRVVVTLGATAAKLAVPRAESSRVDLDTYHGQLYGKLEYEGDAAMWTWRITQPTVFGVRGVHLIPVMSPAAGLLGGDLMTEVLQDFRDLWGVLQSIGRGEYPHPIDPYPFAQYGELTTAAQVSEVLNPQWSITRGRWVAVDTETDGMTGPPWCLSFSTAPGTGWVIPADAWEALEAFKWYVSARRDKWVKVLLHNALFDLGVLRRMGVEGFQWRDTMHTAYQLGNQPQGLKPLAWRLCGMEMVDYSEVVRYPSIPPVLAWGERVAAGVARALPTKLPRKKLVMGPDHKYWKKHAGLLARRMVKLRDWAVGELFPAEVGADFPDPWKWWGERDTQVKQTLMMFGGGLMPQESIVHVPRPRAVQYAGRDADATLRSWLELRRRVRALAKVVPAAGDRPRKTW